MTGKRTLLILYKSFSCLYNDIYIIKLFQTAIFHTETDSLSFNIDLSYCNSHFLIEFYNLVRIFDKLIRHLADMYETVLMNADIDEATECRYVSDYSDQLHANFQIVDSTNILVKFEHLESFTRVATWFLKLINDVVDSLNAALG